MAAPQSPIGSRRRLGAELRRLRLKVGLTLDDVAEMMTCSTSKISRLETGKGVPKVPDVRELMRIYGVTSETESDMLLRLVKDGREHGWWEPLTDGVAPERFVLDQPGRYAALENDATAVRSFDITVVHGLLQIPAYARAVLTATLPHHPPAEIDRLVELRSKRQEALRRADPAPLELHALLDEAVLRRPVGGREVMAAQLEHLAVAAESPNVTIQVLPFTAGILRAHAGHFVLVEIPHALGSDVVYVEGHAGDSYLNGASDVDLYKDVFADASGHAQTAEVSAATIGRYHDEYAPPNPRTAPR
ncbi:helix-turn-helix transcriptional regulator [Pseudonocardia sp.]|uniref:helix-turn-helix domain-containing protein n=1 Tax=Pseudonocardia sp. TaxID=60912 RepID=UPI00260F87C1|nr:helix-turn-helix transcriptional regulator [Pseudonocardia sp.]